MSEFILTCAITGNITRPEQTPYLPITPEQIANSALEAAEAGASIVHVHVRNPGDGRPSMKLEHYAEVVNRIRASNPMLILNLTTGPGGRYVPDPRDPRVAAEGTTLLPPLDRVEHIVQLRPDICSLDLHTMNSGDQVVMNTRRTTRVMAKAMLAAGVKPEIEIFNPGDLVLAKELINDEPSFASPIMFSFVLDVKYGWPASAESIQLGRSILPEGAIWSAFGVGRTEFPMLAMSALLGGHIRVGLEDNLYLERGVLAKSNAELCAKAVRIMRDLGFNIASPKVAREMLRI